MEIDLSDPGRALEQAFDMLSATNAQVAALMIVNKYLIAALAVSIEVDPDELREVMKAAVAADLAEGGDNGFAEKIQQAADLLLTKPRTQAEIVPFHRR